MSDIIAVFWDFEHLHDAIMLQKHGKTGLKKFNGRLQPVAVNVEVVMDYARSFGQVIHNEAFGNWQFFGRYGCLFVHEEAVLNQVFPEDYKLPADVFPALSRRVKTFMELHEDVNTVLFIGLDNDYVTLIEGLKGLGCRVYGVGAEQLNNKEFQGVCDKYIDYYEVEGSGDRPAPAPTEAATRGGDLSKYYLRVAAQQGVRMPPPKIMWIGIDIYASFIKDFEQFSSFKALDDECYDQLVQDISGATMTEVKKIRQVLFKCYLFRPSEDGKISFQENIKGLADIEDCYFDLMLRRIANNLQEDTDYVSLSMALTASPDSADRLKKMHLEINEAEA
jgi:hypothetical protein